MLVVKVPISGLFTCYTSILVLIRSLLGTGTSVFVEVVDVGLFAFDALPRLRDPEVGRVALDAQVVWRQVWRLKWTFALPFLDVIHEALGARLAPQTQIVPEVGRVACHAY